MVDEFKGSRAFIMNYPSITRDKDLLKHPKSILLAGEIISMLNVTGKFFMSNKKIAEILDCKMPTVNNYLTLLEEKGIIKREKILDPNNSKRIIGREITAGDNLAKMSLLGWSSPDGKGSNLQMTRGSNLEMMGVVISRRYKKNNIKEHINRSDNKEVKEDSTKVESIPYKKIIGYLNSKTGRNYKYQTKSYQDLIRSLWKKGYRYKDFIQVINNKGFAWQHSDMWKYMRPSTLFKASKFDEYLNENNIQVHQNNVFGSNGKTPF